MANIEIKSYNQNLGDLIRKIVADTPANDLNKGSVLLTILEAVAANDYENNTAILNVLELLNIDSIRNNDLDAYGSNLGLTRTPAIKASGFIVVKDSALTKRSTTLYAIKPAPIAGTSVLYVNDATGWSATGNVYLGRGTQNFEGPLAYTSIIDNGTFFTINLSTALQKDHLISESVIDGQGTTDRQIVAGTTVKIPANNVSPEIRYSTIRDAVIPAGEDTSENIPIVAVKADSASNAGINTIVLFSALPFTSATVTNPVAFTNGKDTESDENFRDRIKSYTSSLARGTKGSIISSIIGVSDEVDGKQVESANITEPAYVGDPSIVYIDDGQGFQPSYEGQSVDLLIGSANGTEEFLQLANYPVLRPQAVNNAEAPFLLIDGMQLKVKVNGIEESVLFSASDFKNISSATINEVITVINDKSESFKCRLAESSTRILMYPVSHTAETIQVSSDGGVLDANSVFKFSVNEFSYISLYKNNKLLKEIQKPASLSSNPFPTWDITSTGNLIISVDGTPDQDRSFVLTDFGVTSFSSITINDWVRVINTKYAGITAIATSSGRLIITSNREGESSTLEVAGGTYLEKIFGGQPTYATGQNSDFALNRQNGNLQIKVPILAGDTITAGSSDTRGSITSNAANGGNFNFATDGNNRPSEVIFVTDAERVYPRYMNIPVNSNITLSDRGSSVMRIMSSVASSFRSIQPDDYIYITSRGETRTNPMTDPAGSGTWLAEGSCGLFKVVSKGEHLDDNVDTYLEVINANMVVGGPYTVLDSLDIQSFYSDTYPQIWRGSYLATPVAANIQEVVSSINQNIRNIDARVFRTNYIKVSSTTESNGSIAIPVSVGAASQVFKTAQGSVSSSQSHIANKVLDDHSVTIFKRSEPVSSNVWLDRHVFGEVKGSLTSNAVPSVNGSGAYSEILTDTATNFETDSSYDDCVTITSGSNKGQIRNIKTIIDSNNLGTRNATPRTTMDYRSGEEFNISKNIELSYEDNLVLIMDKDSVAKTIDINFSRTGQVNDGSQSGTFIPTNLAFSANDADNEAGIDFGTLNVWGTLASQSSTNFNDYAIWFKARNWYSDNGAAMILRAKEFGPIGDKIRFKTEYPSVPNTEKSLIQSTTFDNTTISYIFGSEAAVSAGLVAGDKFTVTSLGSYMFRLQLPTTADMSAISVNNLISIGTTSGFSSANRGTFRIAAKNDTNKTIDIYNPNGAATVVGNPAVHTIQCLADALDSLNGRYFILNAPNGDTVKFWYDNNNSGTVEPGIGLTTRSWEINISTGDTAVTVATLTAAAILNDPAFATATNVSGTSSLITVTNASKGPSLQGANGTPSPSFGFVLVTPGISATYESLNIVNQIQIYPIKQNDVATIAAAINNGSTLEAVVKTPGTLYKATKDIAGTPVNGVAYDHDPNPLNGKNSYVSLWDSKNWVLTFQNSNPNFQLKKPMLLSNVSSLYQMDTTTNVDGSQGEQFKLIPITLDNIKHQMVHRALSQLDIISDIDFAKNNTKIQIKSQLLGSSGAIEIVGGRANSAKFKLIGDSQVVSGASGNFLELKIPASPNTLSPGQHVMLASDYGVERLNRMISEDTMDVSKFGDSIFDYKYNDKSTYFNQYTKFTIVDANSVDPISYPSAGIVWRWAHDDSGSYAEFTDVANGVVAAAPQIYNAAGSAGSATNLFRVVTQVGSASTKLKFNITSSGQPVQADYLAFQNSAGSTWAAWFSINGNSTAPTGSTYASATNKIRVNILSSDTPNQVISKLVSALLTNAVTVSFSLNQTPAASLEHARPGNLINVFKSSGIPGTGWSFGNFCKGTGSETVGGMPIVKVNSLAKYIDVVNPDGVAMSATQIGTNSLLVTSTPIIEWRLAHSSRIKIQEVTVASNIATATTAGPHGLNVGDTFVDIDIIDNASPDTAIVTAVLGFNQFRYASTNPNAGPLSPVGTIIKTGKSRTKYKIESLNYNDTFRLSAGSGDSPKFKSCGVAVDDILILGGTTFGSSNNGEFRILAVDDESVVYQNVSGSEVLDTYVPFNSYNLEPIWTANSSLLIGAVGTFTNLNIGDWVKKTTDDDTLFVQVSAFNTPLAKDATIITLGSAYSGISGAAPSHRIDQNSGISQGVFLDLKSDVRILEGDSVRIDDEMFITENINTNWFSGNNSGSFAIQDLGTNSEDGRVFLRVNNSSGMEEQGVGMFVTNTRFSITEGDSNKFTCIRQIHHVSIDETNSNRRILYLSGGDRSYKWNQTNSSYIKALGRLNYKEDLISGVDGYQYYIGLLRKVQRIIDGFEPDPISFPGRKAVGSAIEILPPLPVRVSIALDVTTQDGVNLSEISDEISSSIINYVSDLGVGDDVILSDIVVRVKSIVGVAAVTFIVPAPSVERISISDGEKAFIEPTDISIT
jgi:uncharacterized phage protein gp47/JayE